MLTLTLPFSVDALQGAVRRYLSHPTISIDEVVPERLSGGVSGSPVYKLRVSYSGGIAGPGGSNDISLVLKWGADHTGAILAGSARREAHFYRTLAAQLPVRTPRMLLTADDIVGEPTVPLVVMAPGTTAGHWDTAGAGGDWVLMEALPSEVVWPRAHWTAEHYKLALEALADLRATWWGKPPSPVDYPWVWTPTGHHTDGLVREAREAL